MSDLPDRVAGIGALADPVRRELYFHVCAQDHPVSRDEAAEASGIPLHKAKFHLDRLADDGLLDVSSPACPGGAGRERAPVQAVPVGGSRDRRLPPGARVRAGRPPDGDRHRHVDARRRPRARGPGRSGGRVLARSARRPRSEDALRIARSALAEHGYEPRVDHDRAVLANCPFHALSRSPTELVCHMNKSLIDGVTDELVPGRLDTRLDLAEGRCCVTLSRH